MSFMKIGGKCKGGEWIVSLTPTNGLMYRDGSTVASAAYVYSQKIAVNEGDIVTVIKNGSNQQGRVITAFSGDTAIEDKGWYPDSMELVNYTVPSGIDGIVISYSSTLTDASASINRNAVAVGISVDADGIVETKRIFENTEVSIIDSAIRASTVLVLPETPIDISEYAFVSLRVRSSLDVAVQINLYADVDTNAWAVDAYDNPLQINIPVSNRLFIITPEDFPAFNVLTKLKLRIAPASTPTTGSLKIWAVLKR